MNLDIPVKISQFLLTPIITGLSIWLLHENNKYKKNYDLYERRYQFYKLVSGFFETITSDPNKPINDALQNFRYETQEVDFFFGKDIIEYIKEIHSHANSWKINFSKKDQERYTQSEQERFREEYEKEVDWFIDQYGPLKNKFMKYLKLN